MLKGETKKSWIMLIFNRSLSWWTAGASHWFSHENSLPYVRRPVLILQRNTQNSISSALGKRVGVLN